MNHPPPTAAAPPDPVSIYQQSVFTIDTETIDLAGVGPSARPEQLHLAIEQTLRDGGTASMLEALAATEALKAHLEAVSTILVAELATGATCFDQTGVDREHGIVAPDTLVASAISARLTIPRGYATTLVRNSIWATAEYPAVFAALATGRIDRWRYLIICNSLRAHPEVASGEVIDRAIQMAELYTPLTLEKRLRAMLAAKEPEQAREREDRNRARRSVTIETTPSSPGMAMVCWEAPIEDAAIAELVLNAAARQTVDSVPERRNRERVRSDLMAGMFRHALAAGQLDTAAGPVRLGTVAGAKPALNVRIAQLDDGDHTGLIGGQYVSISLAYEIADTLGGQGVPVRWLDQEVMDALLTEAQAIKLDKHDPSPRLRLAVVLRDIHCTFPGCDVKAEDCDLHHLIKWAPGQGLTTLDNLTALCPLTALPHPPPHHRNRRTTDVFPSRPVAGTVRRWTLGG